MQRLLLWYALRHLVRCALMRACVCVLRDSTSGWSVNRSWNVGVWVCACVGVRPDG